MKLGVHLPLIAFDEPRYSLAHLHDYTRAALELGYTTLAANDHLVFQRPWIDGPTALAACIAESGDMDLMTSVALPVVRGPLATAKTLAAIDVLSGGRLIVGVGPGSSPLDYAAVGVPFEERWRRVDEAVQALRALWSGDAPPFEGTFYSTAGLHPEPPPAQRQLPIWIGAWGSPAGLRRVARLADGWLASGYNTTPADFAEAWKDLRARLEAAGRSASDFPNGLATIWTFISEDAAATSRALDGLATFLRRPREQLEDRLLVGSPEACAAKLMAYRDAGLQRALIWPIADEIAQIELFAAKVRPLVAA